MRDYKINVIASSQRTFLAMTESKEIHMPKKNKYRRSASAQAIQSARVEFNPDYSTTKRDLKRIGTLAGFFIVVLVVLSFFLR